MLIKLNNNNKTVPIGKWGRVGWEGKKVGFSDETPRL